MIHIISIQKQGSNHFATMILAINSYKNCISSLFITHDIEEAIYISDRILILNGEPAKIRKEINIREKKLKGKLALEDEIEIRKEILHSLYEETKN